MIHWFILLWLVPLTTSAGFMLGALCRTAKKSDLAQLPKQPFCVRSDRRIETVRAERILQAETAVRRNKGVRTFMERELVRELAFTAMERGLISFSNFDDRNNHTYHVRATIDIVTPGECCGTADKEAGEDA